jgi:hypothetical protein
MTLLHRVVFYGDHLDSTQHLARLMGLRVVEEGILATAAAAGTEDDRYCWVRRARRWRCRSPRERSRAIPTAVGDWQSRRSAVVPRSWAGSMLRTMLPDVTTVTVHHDGVLPVLDGFEKDLAGEGRIVFVVADLDRGQLAGLSSDATMSRVSKSLPRVEIQ